VQNRAVAIKTLIEHVVVGPMSTPAEVRALCVHCCGCQGLTHRCPAADPLLGAPVVQVKTKLAEQAVRLDAVLIKEASFLWLVSGTCPVWHAKGAFADGCSYVLRVCCRPPGCRAAARLLQNAARSHLRSVQPARAAGLAADTEPCRSFSFGLV
jgi:hypothetical protein